MITFLQVTYSVRGAEVSLIDQNALSQSKNRVIRLLYPIPDGSILLRRFLELYKNMCGEECPLSFLTDHMDDIVTVSNDLIFLFHLCNYQIGSDLIWGSQ